MISSKEPFSPFFAPRLLYIYRASDINEENKNKKKKKEKNRISKVLVRKE